VWDLIEEQQVVQFGQSIKCIQRDCRDGQIIKGFIDKMLTFTAQYLYTEE
jgi:hypothetical protein